MPPLDSPMDDQKSKALSAALAQIEKQFGKGSIMKMGEAQIANDLSVVSTGSLGLDIALGVGGLPRGRVVEIYGPESSGKTTLCLQVVAQIQKAGGVAAYIDAENALDPVYAGKLGVNVGDLLILGRRAATARGSNFANQIILLALSSAPCDATKRESSPHFPT